MRSARRLALLALGAAVMVAYARRHGRGGDPGGNGAPAPTRDLRRRVERARERIHRP